MARSFDIAVLASKVVAPSEPPATAAARAGSIPGTSTSETGVDQNIGDVVTGGTQDGITATYDATNHFVDYVNTDKGTVAVAAHVVATDPHGDRAYAVAQDAAHVAASDPHGDRAYALAQDAAHVAASDPHTQYVQVANLPELVDDRVAALLVEGANVTLTYNDVANTLTIASSGGGGGGTWGSITGTLSAQTDLQAALDAKLDDTQATAFGLSVLGAANAGAGRTALGLGTMATEAAANYAALAGATYTGPVTGTTFTAGTNGFIMDAAAGVNRRLVFQTAGVDRWRIGVGAGAEAGSNAGSDFVLQRFSDAGTSLGTPMSIARSSGAISMGTLNVTVGLTAAGTTSLTGDLDVTGDVTLAAGLAGYLAKLNVRTATTYTLVAGDSGKIIDHANAGAITVTLPNSLSVGFSVTYVQTGAGQITFTPAAGASRRNRSAHTKTAGQWAMVTLFVRTNSTGTNAEWVLGGDTAA